MIIDSHCHLTYEPMSKALKETIDRANKDGIKYMLTISTEDMVSMYLMPSLFALSIVSFKVFDIGS